jgi:hypothetical protein
MSSGGNSSSQAGSAGNTARKAADSAEDAGQQAMDSKPFRVLLTVGLIAYGVVHILIGWIAVQIAWSGQPEGEQASQQGALDQLASQPLGTILLWLVVVGLFAMAIWQLAEAIWGHRDRPSGMKRTRKRLGSAGRTFTYAAIAIAAIGTLRGSKSDGNKEEGYTARLLSVPFGRILVIVVAIVIIVLGVRLARRGITKKFTEDLAGGIGREVVRLGQAGYIVKGIAFVIVGGLFGWAAITYDPEKAGGLDDALRTVHEAPAGSVLLTVMALGLIAFGVYCFFWARHPNVSTCGGNAGELSN